MAHFAEIDSNNIVIRVIVVDDSLEENGADWCNKTFGGNWVQTSYNTYGGKHSTEGKSPLRSNYACIGYRYNSRLDAFIPPKPFPSWKLNNKTGLWEPPVKMPINKVTRWDEKKQKWVPR